MQNIEIIINKGEPASFEEELAQDVIEIITVFSARLYGSRSHKTKRLLNEPGEPKLAMDSAVPEIVTKSIRPEDVGDVLAHSDPADDWQLDTFAIDAERPSSAASACGEPRFGARLCPDCNRWKGARRHPGPFRRQLPAIARDISTSGCIAGPIAQRAVPSS